MLTKNKRLFKIILSVLMLLLFPLVAMQLTSEVDWSPFDFAIAAALLFAAGFSCEYILRKVKTTQHRVILCGSILVLLVLVWAELAAGIFGTLLAGS